MIVDFFVFLTVADRSTQIIKKGREPKELILAVQFPGLELGTRLNFISRSGKLCVKQATG